MVVAEVAIVEEEVVAAEAALVVVEAEAVEAALVGTAVAVAPVVPLEEVVAASVVHLTLAARCCEMSDNKREACLSNKSL